MDDKQKQHLKAYGIAYWVLQKGIEAHWRMRQISTDFLDLKSVH